MLMAVDGVPDSPTRHWSAIVPLAISLGALVFVLGWAALVGVEPHEDEGTPAHLFQLMMAVQLPIIGYFAFKWLPRRRRDALLVLVLQGVAWLAALGTLYLFEQGIVQV